MKCCIRVTTTDTWHGLNRAWMLSGLCWINYSGLILHVWNLKQTDQSVWVALWRLLVAIAQHNYYTITGQLCVCVCVMSFPLQSAASGPTLTRIVHYHHDTQLISSFSVLVLHLACICEDRQPLLLSWLNYAVRKEEALESFRFTNQVYNRKYSIVSLSWTTLMRW